MPKWRVDAFGARVNKFATLFTVYRSLSRYERTGDPDALERAIFLLRRVLATPPADDHLRAIYLAVLGEVLGLRYERVTMELDDLHDAVTMARQAVMAIPINDPDRGKFLSSFALALRLLGEQTQKLEDLEEALAIARQSVAAAPTDPASLAGLSVALQLLYERTQELEYLTEAVTIGRQAVAAVATNDRDRAKLLTILGGAVHLLSQRTQKRGDLVETVTVARQALAAISTRHPNRAGYISNLGVALQRLYEQTRELDDLTEAVNVGRQAVAAIPTNDPRRADCLNDLGSTLWQMYKRLGKPGFLTEAVAAQREAVATTPASHPYRAGYISNLGITLHEVYERTRKLEFLTESVAAQREAVAATPSNHPNKSSYLNALGMALLDLFDQTRVLATLTEAVAVGRQAVALIPADHPDRAGYQNNLGKALWQVFEETNELSALIEAREILADATSSPVAAVTVRINAGRGLGLACMSAGDPHAALSALEAVVELVPQVAPWALSRQDREYALSQLAGLSNQVAAAATAAGQPERAIELLEQTRGVLIGEAIDARSDLSELRRAAPDLAAEFDNLREEIADSDDAEPSPMHERFIWDGRDGEVRWRRATGLAELAERRRNLASEWTALLERIRSRAGFEQFLCPPSISRLRRQAADGPLIIVYASRWRADALIISDPAHSIHVVPLPGLTDSTAAEQVNQLLAACAAANCAADETDASQDEIHAVLGWLWDTITGPVLDHLNITSEQGSRPRIWWCPVGVLAHLPLHAAGHHTHTATTPVPRTVLDRAISSYTITLRALEHARARRNTSQAPTGSSVLIAMPTTPGAPELPGAAHETQMLASLLGSALTLIGAQATYQTVTAALPRHRIAHFACHGLSEAANPAASRLLLHDHQRAPLTVTALMGLQLADAELAYLSACSTTQTTPALTDEAVHLTAAVHLAGYPRVIGTLWPVDDTAATIIAKYVYTHLTDGGAHPPHIDNSAYALAEATRLLRDAIPAAPTRWAGHLHLGA